MLRSRRQSNSNTKFVNVLKGNANSTPFFTTPKKLRKQNIVSTPPASKTVVIIASLLSFGVIAITFILLSISSLQSNKANTNSSDINVTDAISTIDSLMNAYHNSIENVHHSKDITAQFAEYDSILETAISSHCMPQLTFDIKDKKIFSNALFAHIDLWINSLVHNSIVEDLNPKTTFVTNQGTIIDITHSKHATDFKPTEYASCNLVQGLIAKSKDMHLVSDSNKYVDEFGIDTEEYFNSNMNTYFKDSNINKDALKLVNDAVTNQLYDMEMEFPAMLNNYCGHVFNALESKNNNKNKDKYEASHNFLSQMQHILHLISDSVTIESGSEEIPIIDTDGKLYFIHREELLTTHNEYMQCELLEKLVFYSQSGNDIKQHSKILSNDIKIKTDSTNSHNVRLSAAYAFESRSELLLEKHCSNVVSTLHKTNKMYEFKGNFLSFVENIVAGDHFVGDSDDWIVTNDGSILHRDIALSNGHKDIMECNLIKYISFQGDHNSKLDEKHEHMFDTSTIFNQEFEDELIDIDAHRYSSNKETEYEFDSNLLYEHVANKEHTRFMVASERMLNYHHSKELSQMNKNTVEHLLSDIQDILEILIDNGNIIQYIDGETQSGFSKTTGVWSISEDNDWSDDEVLSPFLNNVLKYFIHKFEIKQQQQQITSDNTQQQQNKNEIEQVIHLVNIGDYYESSMQLEHMIDNKCASSINNFETAEQFESFYDQASHLLYHVATGLYVPENGVMTIEKNQLVYSLDNTKKTTCTVINEIFEYGITQNKNIKQTETQSSIQDAISFFKESFEISSQTNNNNKKEQNIETKPNSDIQQYVTLLKEDVKKSNNIEQVKKDIVEDLQYFCKYTLEHLSSRQQRRLRAHILDLVENHTNIKNAVITSNGLIQSSNDVKQNEKQWKCEFVTELLQ